MNFPISSLNFHFIFYIFQDILQFGNGVMSSGISLGFIYFKSESINYVYILLLFYLK